MTKAYCASLALVLFFFIVTETTLASKLQPNELPIKWHHPTIIDEKSNWHHPTNYDEQKKWNHPVVNATCDE